jgi:hypothetical protein
MLDWIDADALRRISLTVSGLIAFCGVVVLAQAAINRRNDRRADDWRLPSKDSQPEKRRQRQVHNRH